MSRSRNDGQSLSRYLKGNDKTNRSKQGFVGIVRDVIGFNSPSKEELIEDQQEGVFDNRNMMYIQPIDTTFSSSLIRAYPVNSHDIDVPIIGEAVLCMNSGAGFVVVDRLSTHAFGVNSEISDYLLTNNLVPFSGVMYDREGEDEKYLDEIGTESIQRVAPFYPKPASKNTLGRNNQYLIFDHGARLEATKKELENTRNGSYVKMGFRKEGSQHDNFDDPTISIMTRRANVRDLLEYDLESRYENPVNDQSEDTYGTQSDEIIFVGRRFVCIYSKKDILMKARDRFILEFRQFIAHGDDIRLGSEEAEHPFVLGDQVVKALEDMLDIIQNMQYATPAGPTSGALPTSLVQLRSYKAKYLGSGSPLLSRKIYGE